MGMSYIAFIQDDAIRVARGNPEAWVRIRSELGEALLTLCLRQPKAPWSISRATSPPFLTHQVGNTYGGVGVCDEVHTLDQRVFVWHRDSLKALDKATDEELEIASELIAAERRRRIRAG